MKNPKRWWRPLPLPSYWLDNDFLQVANRPMYHDQKGRPMHVLQWAREFNNFSRAGKAKRRLSVKRSCTQRHLVATIWYGLDETMLFGPPTMFHTIVLCRHDGGRIKPPDNGCPLNQHQLNHRSKRHANIRHTYVKRWVKKLEREGVA